MDFPIEHDDIPASHVSLPEGIHYTTATWASYRRRLRFSGTSARSWWTGIQLEVLFQGRAPLEHWDMDFYIFLSHVITNDSKSQWVVHIYIYIHIYIYMYSLMWSNISQWNYMMIWKTIIESMCLFLLIPLLHAWPVNLKSLAPTSFQGWHPPSGSPKLEVPPHSSAPFTPFRILLSYFGWWFGTCFTFPDIGNHHPNSLFQLGWNHQPVYVWTGHDFQLTTTLQDLNSSLRRKLDGASVPGRSLEDVGRFFFQWFSQWGMKTMGKPTGKL